MTDKLAEIKARLAAIGEGLALPSDVEEWAREDQEFLEHAPEDISLLLATCERLREALGKVKDLSELCLVAGFQHGKTPGFDLPEIKAAKRLREEILAALEEVVESLGSESEGSPPDCPQSPLEGDSRGGVGRKGSPFPIRAEKPLRFRKEKTMTCLLAGIVMIVFVTAFTFLETWFLWWAWNWLAVSVFHAPPLTYWQVFVGLIALNLVLGAMRSSVTTKE